MMDLSQSVELEIIKTIKETDKAWQIKLPCGIYWLPKSQVRVLNKKVFIPKWLAEEKGIDYLSCDITNL